MIKRTGLFNLSVLSKQAPFSVFEAFGFLGKEKEKFDGQTAAARSANGLYYLTEYTNAYIAAG